MQNFIQNKVSKLPVSGWVVFLLPKAEKYDILKEKRLGEAVMAKYIGYAVSICLISLLLEYLNRRKHINSNLTGDGNYYILKIPSALKYVYLTMFGLGIFLFCVFLFFYRIGNPTVTIGHLNFSIIFATIGLAIAIWAERWRIVVDGKQMEIHRLFHRPKKILIPEIGKVMIGKKHQLTLYDASGKKLITVDILSDNYDKLLKTLKNNNIQVKNND